MNNKVKIKVSIDTDNAKHVSALNTFLEALNTSGVVTEAPKKAPARPASKAKAVEDIKVEAPENVLETIADEAKELANRPAMEVVEKEEPAKEEPAKEEPAKEEPAKAITREEVRLIMAPKVATHRDAIANQLRNVMGFQSVTLLPEDKLQEFADYLNTLN